MSSMRMWQQHTIRSLVERLHDLGDRPVGRLHTPHSHRGDYVQLAFEVSDDMVPARSLVDFVAGCIGPTFEGWRGGSYVYAEYTAVCAAEEGHAGGLLCGPDDDGNWIIACPA